MINYETVSEAVNDLFKRGYTDNFNWDETKGYTDCPVGDSSSICLTPRFYKIDEIHRFEGMTDPADQMIIYAISSKIFLKKGIIVNAYGVYSDSEASLKVQHLKV